MAWSSHLAAAEEKDLLLVIMRNQHLFFVIRALVVNQKTIFNRQVCALTVIIVYKN